MCKVTECLQQARELIDALDVKNYISVQGPGDYTMADGRARFTVVSDEGSIELIYGDVSAGVSVEKHIHEVKELFVVHSGDISITDSGGEHRLGVGDIYYVEPHTEHFMSSRHGGSVLIIRIPSANGTGYGRH